ncbi:hypothetical protein [uncultured Mucilaginibacter sp.]|uniref:hypothetical protein n=1 Tax=uncultured Mucilaginibacter sp. TaxID=797541 RepID=UPI002613ED6C|nr:hypothetical protein [uncultured Mucilaginibacter sp.]
MNLKKALLHLTFACTSLTMLTNCSESSTAGKLFAETGVKQAAADTSNLKKTPPPPKPIDTKQYDSLMRKLANGDTTGNWPVKNTPYPLAGAILPEHRIVAFYGNLYSKRMGILGELPPNEMLRKLDSEVKNWEKADPSTPVIPALHYIAIVAQGDGGADGKFRYRMPFKQIDSVLAIAKKRDALVFLDVQVALSNIRTELPLFEKYLKMPNVHFGMDPEFSMKSGAKPGTKIGTYDADDINFASNYLTDLVKKNNLTPKILIVHRFTKNMVTNYKQIKLHPEVQLVMDMDGWGEPELKKGTYRNHIYKEPVQFTGFKLFYKNDLKKAPNHMMTPGEVLALKPKPIYIQYQ